MVKSILNDLNDQIKKNKKIINLAIGEPLVSPPGELSEICSQVINEGYTKYMPTGGDPELILAIQEKLKKEDLYYKEDEIVVTAGAKPALTAILKVLLGIGSGVIVPEPFYPPFVGAVQMLGGQKILVDTKNDFQLTVEKIQKKLENKRILPRVIPRIIIINSPNNPTGSIYSQGELRKIAEFAFEKNLFIISDETYCDFGYTEKPLSIANIGYRDKIIIVRSFSKSYNVPGLRIGYVAGPKRVIKEVKKVIGTMFGCACSISQRIAIMLLNNKTYPKNIKSIFFESRGILLDWLEKNNIPFVEPQGAFYVFPDFSEIIKTKKFGDSVGLVNALIQNSVAIAPGVAFGKNYTNHARIAFCCSPTTMEKAIKKMNKII